MIDETDLIVYVLETLDIQVSEYISYLASKKVSNKKLGKRIKSWLTKERKETENAYHRSALRLFTTIATSEDVDWTFVGEHVNHLYMTYGSQSDKVVKDPFGE